jgi:hypothetical protein
MHLMTAITPSTPKGLPGEFEKLHYDITSSSRIDALSNTGYSYNCGIASSYLNPSLISDTGLAHSRFGISYYLSSLLMLITIELEMRIISTIAQYHKIQT